MPLKRILFISIALLAMEGCSFMKVNTTKTSSRPSPFQQVDFLSLVKRYMKKDNLNPVEGIYSVSGSVTKRKKGLLGGDEKEKTTDRKENYAKVAILLDPGDTGRDFIELSLDKEDLPAYSIVGEFNKASGGNMLVYKHLDSKGKNTSFTFTMDPNGDLLEGIRVEKDGSATITYKLTYVKLSK
jgi:hypothetical protein